ncbi:D-2-hydroxyacid dehydrogenase [Oceanobacillus saliphilus]|uniref:D-2-hydroxyacid dehydrogenase n=1 Tax=Oceanobacillus saliphilus TaxID=2925834 RepID=UPI00201D56A4|nr:D-2-hydroxyacid dehydrogenase [Oceanobacillus saliphilus]
MILFPAKISSRHREKLREAFPEQKIVFSDNQDETLTYLPEAEIYVTYGNDINETLISKAENLKWIMVLSAGVDELPFQMLEEKGIMVTNVRGIHKVQMAEYAISMLLQVYRNEKVLFQNENDEKWDKSVRINEITGKTIVIAGTGAIGQEVARLAKAFRMKTIGISRSGKKVDYFDENHTNEDLTEVLPQADFLVSVLPSTKETKHFYIDEHFKAMPNHGVFLNMGRGDAVKSETILKAVETGEIAHAVLDVFEEEPLPANHPFWNEANITITPHLSGLSPHYVTRAMEIFTMNLEKYLERKDDFMNKINLSRGY